VNVLAIETSGAVGAVAACSDGTVLAEETLAKGLTQGRLLVPIIDAAVKRAGWDVRKDVDLIAVSQGPGSFTGLRVGLTAARTIAALTGVPLIGVCSLQVMAENAPASEDAILTILDAKRGEVYAAGFSRTGESLARTFDPCVAGPASLLIRFAAPPYVMGNGLDLHAHLFSANGCRIAPNDEWTVRAPVVARLGAALFKSGVRSDPMMLQPIYLRLAEAEEKRLARERSPK